MFGPALDEASRLLGVRRGRRMPPPAVTLLPISPTLLKRPEDWLASVHLTGPWMDSGTASELDPRVAAFIAAGPYAYARFGSMAMGDPVARGRALVDAARRRGLRLLVATGLGGIAVEPDLQGDDVLTVRSAPHSLVLPGAVAAVHHGGIGTVQAVTRTATVSVIVPFIADQPFWGAILHRRGLTPAAISQRRATADRLGTALDAVEQYRSPVAGAAERMAKEDGTAQALAVIAALR